MAAAGMLPGGGSATDPRAAALARYLRQCAATFSMSADVTDTESTAEAGMALLDAADLADSMEPDDPRIKILSEANLFESMPHGQACFVETTDIRAAIRRPLLAGAQTGVAIIAELISTARATDESPHEEWRP